LANSSSVNHGPSVACPVPEAPAIAGFATTLYDPCSKRRISRDP
jgi:hypothetical protein